MKIENGKIYVKYWEDEYIFTYRENEKLKVDIEEIRALPLKPNEKANILELILDAFYRIPIKSAATYITFLLTNTLLTFQTVKIIAKIFMMLLKTAFSFLLTLAEIWMPYWTVLDGKLTRKNL